MRVTLLAVAMALFASVLPVSAQALMQHYTLNIPRQSLDSALKDFAQQTGLQVARFSDRVDGSAVVGPIRGDMSVEQALKSLLERQGLRFVMVDERTVAIVKSRQGSAHPSSNDENSGIDKNNDNEETRSKSLWDQFRLAQVDQGSASQTQLNRQGGPTTDDTGAKLEEITVTGRRFLSVDTSGTTNLPLPIEQVPQSISLVSNDFIQAADLKTLGAIAEYTPGAINAGNESNVGTTIKLRGFSAGQSVDGINILNYSFYEPEYAIYDRLEIVKGPSSVVYGVSSPGGLVNYVTKSATAHTPTYLFAQVGSWGNYRLEGQTAGALDADEHIRAVAIAVQDAGNSFVHELYHKKTSLYGGLNVDLGNSVEAYLHGGYQRQQQPSLDGIPTEADGSPAPVPRSFFIGSRTIGTIADIYHAEGDLTWHAAGMLDFSIKGNYQSIRNSGALAYSFGLQPTGDLGINASDFKARNTNYGIGVSSIYKFDDFGIKDSFVSLAALYQNNDFDENFAYPASPGVANIFNGEAAVSQAFSALLASPLSFPFSVHTKADTLTFSAQSILRIIDPLTVLLGTSYSKPTQTVLTNKALTTYNISGQTSLRAGVTYEFIPKTYAYISYSQSFTPQTQLAVDQTLLPPITGEQYEAGLKYRDDNARLLLTAAAFQIREKHVSQYSETVNGVDYFAALGEVTHKGLELQGIGQITRQWQINAGYAYLDPKITHDSDAANVGQTELFLPTRTASVYTTYALQDGLLGGLSFGGGVRFVGSQKTSHDGSTEDLPNYTLVDLNMGYAIDKWLVQMNARNVFDRHYFINNYQTLFYGNVVGEPANVALFVRREF